MKTKCRMILVVFLAVFLWLGSACSTGATGSPNPLMVFATSTSIQELPTATATKTETALPSRTPTVAPSATATQSPTATPVPPTATITPMDTPWPFEQTLAVLPTVIDPTAIPIAENDVNHSDLEKQGYRIIYDASIIGPGDSTYSVYLYIDSSFLSSGLIYRDLTDSEGCRIAFYRSDGQRNKQIVAFPAPALPEEAVYPGYPTVCMPANWNQPSTFWSFTIKSFDPPTDSDYQALGLNGVWSDINQNGLPEFGMIYSYCSNACDVRYGDKLIHFYEIQSPTKVVDVTADLPGIIDLWKIFRSAEPLEFYVYDPGLSYYWKWTVIDTWWIYSWDGKKFTDVSSKYQDEYLEEGKELRESLAENDGQFFPEADILKILFLYQKAGLRDQAYQEFMEISNPAQWPNADSWQLCWLQMTRAKVQEDYAKGVPFELPSFRLQTYLDEKELLSDAIKKVDQDKYDVSACTPLLPKATQTP